MMEQITSTTSRLICIKENDLLSLLNRRVIVILSGVLTLLRAISFLIVVVIN